MSDNTPVSGAVTKLKLYVNMPLSEMVICPNLYSAMPMDPKCKEIITRHSK